MKVLVTLAISAVLTLAPASIPALADAPNIGVAANGDRVAITCESRGDVCGTFSVHPKAAEASGEFVHTNADGRVLGAGTWKATQLMDYQSYGCGVVFGMQIPPNFCGGKVKLRVTLTTAIGQFDGILTVFCIVGPNPPDSHDELDGATLSVPGIINFNHAVDGDNVFIKL
jgi:hypothetical protein